MATACTHKVTKVNNEKLMVSEKRAETDKVEV